MGVGGGVARGSTTTRGLHDSMIHYSLLQGTVNTPLQPGQFSFSEPGVYTITASFTHNNQHHPSQPALDYIPPPTYLDDEGDLMVSPLNKMSPGGDIYASREEREVTRRLDYSYAQDGLAEGGFSPNRVPSQPLLVSTDEFGLLSSSNYHSTSVQRTVQVRHMHTNPPLVFLCLYIPIVLFLHCLPLLL